MQRFALLTGLRRHAQKQPTPRRQMWEARGLHHGTCAGNWFAGRQGVGARGMTEKLAGPRTCPAAAAAPATVEMADFLSAGAPGDAAPPAPAAPAPPARLPLCEKKGGFGGQWLGARWPGCGVWARGGCGRAGSPGRDATSGTYGPSPFRALCGLNLHDPTITICTRRVTA